MAAMLRNEIGSQETPLWMPWATLAAVLLLGVKQSGLPRCQTRYQYWSKNRILSISSGSRNRNFLWPLD
jgi:hypothetical protein